MNLFKSLKNKKGMSGAVKGAMILLTLAFAVASASYIIPVLAIHETTAVITPVWLKPNTFYEFQINVSNALGSGDYISEVRLYNSSANPPTNPNSTIYNNFKCYADNDTSSVPYIWDLGYGKSFGVIYCFYADEESYPTGTIGPGQSKTFYMNATTNDIETCLHWTVEPRSTAGQWSTVSAAYTCVDKTPPNTTKTYGTPSVVDGAYRWITSATPITLTAVDGGPLYPPTGQIGVGVDKIQYRITKLAISDNDCIEACKQEGSGDWKEWDGTPFTISEDSCHLIEFYANDSLGNTEAIHRQCVFVDNQPPVSSKSLIGETYTDPSGQTWITQNTLINLTCEDQQPHPSDNVKIYYRWQLDDGTWHDWALYSPLMSYTQDSVHNLEWYCVDAVGNEEEHHFETDRVDSTPPIITKTIIGPQVGTCPPKSPSDTCYIKDTASGDGTIVSVDATDPDPTGQGCNVDQVKCEYYYLLDDGTEKMGFHDDIYSPFNITFSDDSKHDLYVKCWDKLGNIAWDNETFLVDSIPPITVKTYGDPTIVKDPAFDSVKENYRWITSDTPITLTSTDNKVGVHDIQYRVTKLNITDENCYEACSGVEGSGDWQEATGSETTFTIPEDSCHLIEFYANDTLGNTETIHKQCVFVDNKEPQMIKTIGDPSIPVVGTGCENITYDGAVPSGSGATIEPNKLGSLSEPIVLKPGESINESKIVTTSETPIGKLDVVFLFDLTGSMGDVIDSAKTNAITIMNNITSLIADSQFGVGSFRDYNNSYSSCGYSSTYGDPTDQPWYFNQDITNNTAAISTAISGFFANGGSDGPEGYARALYESSQDFSWRAGARKVVIIFGDDVPHDCNLGSYYDGTGSCSSTTGRDPGRDGVVGTADDLNWSAVVSDLKAADISVAFVDLSNGNACPGAWKYATNQTGGIYTLDTGNLPAEIVASVQNITGEIKHLTLETKPGFENWVEWTPQEYTDVKGGEIKDFNVTITVPAGQPGGNYHFYIKVMGDGAILAVEEIFVHVDAPACAGGETFTWVRDSNSLPGTPITLSCDDSWNGKTPHPIGGEMMCYKVSFDKPGTPWLTDKYCKNFGGDYNSSTGECCEYLGASVNYTLTFTEDSNHDLEFYCTDALGNKGTVDIENFKVDSTPPIITKTIIGPRIGCGPSDTSCYIKDWSNSDGTTIHVEAVDDNALGCAVGGVKCEYYYLLDDNTTKKGFVDDSAPPFDIKFNDDSKHELHIKCWDALKNKVEDTETFLVDSIPPETEKTYGTPFYTDGTSDWITSQTPINLTSTDNKVGVDKTYYKYAKVDDSNCYNDTLCQGLPSIDKTWDSATPSIFGVVSFNIPEDSCHLIEFYSVDKLGNVETAKRQCVFVDNQPPKVGKTISDPKEHWIGDDTFYFNLTKRCAAGDIDCWKITLGTTLNITCNDSQPHPVDNSKMCFQVELDGDDKTQAYCGSIYIDGTFNESGDGYCCLGAGENIENFQFAEESQHDLKVKCVDALGNQGPVDEEKFKVEGCTEQLCLYKKWNLISVPFVLFNDTPSEVFKNMSDDIVSVWTYDNGNWSVWTPGCANPQDCTLTSIKPGWGYWVLAKDDKCFDISGSLFSPITTPPSKDLQPGWNLIGYYGNTGPVLYDSVAADPPKCFIAGKPVYCALNSLIDTQEGFPRWSSLWNYFNNGGDDAGWTGLDACISRNWAPAPMEPFKGYWIEMDVKDGYAPATNCIWNSDMKCVNNIVT